LPERRQRFEEIYDAYSGLILAYAARRTGNAADAADIVAETFTVAWRRLGDVPAGDQARPWLYGVARGVLANHHRSIRRRRRLDERAIAEFAPLIVVEPADPDGPEAGRIAAALDALSATDRELLTLVGWDGLDPGEIASVLGTSPATVRVRLHRARKRFARLLAADGMQRPTITGHEPGRWAPAHPDHKDAR